MQGSTVLRCAAIVLMHFIMNLLLRAHLAECFIALSSFAYSYHFCLSFYH